MLDHVSVLLVLVVWPRCLDYTLHSIYRARNPVASNKFCKVPKTGEMLADHGLGDGEKEPERTYPRTRQ